LAEDEPYLATLLINLIEHPEKNSGKERPRSKKLIQGNSIFNVLLLVVIIVEIYSERRNTAVTVLRSYPI